MNGDSPRNQIPPLFRGKHSNVGLFAGTSARDRPGGLVVVTGASSGIGAATAASLAAMGTRVVLVARSRQGLENVQAHIGGKRVTLEPLDAANGDAVLAMAERVRRRFGVPDAVINSAGAGQWKFIEETAPGEAVQMMGAPYFAAYNVTHAFMAGMLERGSGCVVHVGSPASLMAWPGATGYIAARWALRGLHEALCQDLRGTGVHSIHVVFGKVSSDYFRNNPGSEEHIPTLGSMIPVSTPERCAEIIIGALRRPRPLVIYPKTLALVQRMADVAPRLMRWAVASTGRQH